MSAELRTPPHRRISQTALVFCAPRRGTNTDSHTTQGHRRRGARKDWVDVKEGEASLFRPENGGYQLMPACRWKEWLTCSSSGEVRPGGGSVEYPRVRVAAVIVMLSAVDSCGERSTADALRARA